MGNLGVGFDELLDVLLVLRSALFEVANGQGQVRELRERGEQRRRGRRIAGIRHVVRDGTEQRESTNASLTQTDLHEGGQGRGKLHVVRDLGSARRQQGSIGRLDMDGGRPRVGYAGGHAVQRESDLDARALANVVDSVREGLPV